MTSESPFLHFPEESTPEMQAHHRALERLADKVRAAKAKADVPALLLAADVMLDRYLGEWISLEWEAYPGQGHPPRFHGKVLGIVGRCLSLQAPSGKCIAVPLIGIRTDSIRLENAP